MTLKFSRLRRSLLAAAALLVSVPAGAQILGSQAGLSLSQYLTVLADDPRDVRALIGAGEAALELGDADAAMGFFQRAEAVDPRDGRARAGMGRLWLSQEKSAEAIKAFDAAVRMGVPEASIASDRGLAYDLRGDPRQAQHDYALAVRRGGDDEAIRRYALSLGISGDRDKALAMLDPLLIKQDRAAWRARAFVLAMSGDVAGARGIVDAVMPSVAQPMMPFFTRLRGLSPGQRAAAVHFGHIPSDGRIDGRGNYDLAGPDGRIAAAEGPLTPADSLNARPADAPASGRVAQVSRDPRRRPGQAIETRAPVAAARADAKPARRASSEPKPVAGAPVRVALADLPPLARAQLERAPDPVTATVVARVQADAPAFGPSAPKAPMARAEPNSLPARAPITPVDVPARAAPVVNVLRPAPEAAISQTVTPAPAAPRRAPPAVSLDAIVADLKVESAPETAAAPQPIVRPAPRPVAPKVAPIPLAKPKPEPAKPIATAKTATEKPGAKPQTAAEKKAADKKIADKKLADKKIADKKLADKKAAAKPDPAKLHPARVWAQVLTGADQKELAKDFGKLAKKSPGAFKGQAGYSVPFRGTRRLLVGPFASTKKAQEFLKNAGLTGFPFESPAGMEISKLPAK